MEKCPSSPIGAAEGRLTAAAYGAAPAEECPSQTSRDGEDYAVAMLPPIAEQPFEALIDCQGTLDTGAALAKNEGATFSPTSNPLFPK